MKLALVPMHPVKDTGRALVRIAFDGLVHKHFRGPQANDRFDNEVRVLRYLEKRACPFVPRLLEVDSEHLKIVTTNCGKRVEHISADHLKELYAELEAYGVRHDDPYLRNITYDQKLGRFCIIDFEIATLLDKNEQPTVKIGRPDDA